MPNEIKNIRKKFDLTQVELAKMLGISQPRISEMEQQKTVTVNTLRKIAKALNVSIKDLVNNGTE
jgi:transcriptional regulator with XRE-family HTH domain